MVVDQQGKQTDNNDVTYPHSFKEVYAQLPGKLSKNMSKNLSVSIAFVCILHLANEKVRNTNIKTTTLQSSTVFTNGCLPSFGLADHVLRSLHVFCLMRLIQT